MYKQPILNKVPGNVSCGNKEKQGYIQDISKLTKSELLDLKERQELLLRNKKRISALPDKGLKIRNFYEKILNQLKIHESVDHAAEMFSELNIASLGKKSLTKMEWSGKYNQYQAELDSDDEIDVQNIDPLKILASVNTGKIIKTTKPEKTLITQNDLEEIDKFKREQADLHKSANEINTLLGKTLPSDDRNPPTSSQILHGHSKHEKFLPSRTAKSYGPDREQEKQRFKFHSGKFENTSATPPPLTHPPVKVLSLEESVQLQEEKNNLLQQARERYEGERLLQRQEINEKLTSTIYRDVMQGSNGLTTYRDVSDSEEEIHEEDVEYDLEIEDSSEFI